MPSPALRKLEVEANAAFDQVSFNDYDAIEKCIFSRSFVMLFMSIYNFIIIFYLQYRELYFEGGVSSVYLWDLDAGFAGVILIKKAGDGSKKIKGMH